MTNVPRSRTSWIPGALGLAVLVVIGWTLLRIGRSIGKENGTTVEAADSVATTETRSNESPLPSSSPKAIRQGRRVHPGKDAAADGSSDGAGSMDATDSKTEPYATVALVGRVTGHVGETVGGPNTLVELKGANGVSTVPVSMGAYRIEDLDPGTFELRCSAPGLREETRTITIGENETEHREDFVLEPLWTVAIRLMTPEGRNFTEPDLQAEIPKGWTADGKSIDVVATPTPPSERWTANSAEDRLAHRGSRFVPRVRADEIIAGDADGSCIGQIEIDEKPPVYLAVEMRGVVLATTRLESEVALATLVVRLDALRSVPCSLRAKVVAIESGIPIANATAELYLGYGSANLPVDAEGNLVGGKLPPGRCTLTIRAEGRGTDSRELELRPSIENDLGTIALDAEVRIRGRFVDPSGQSVRSDAEVFAYSRDHPLDFLDTVLYVGVEVLTRDGFEHGALAPRTYVLLDRDRNGQSEEWWVLPTVVDLSRGSVEDLDVHVLRATQVALSPVSDDVRELQYWVLAPNGILCAHGLFASRGEVRLTLGSGNFRLLVGKDSSHVREIPFAVGGAPTTVAVGS